MINLEKDVPPDILAKFPLLDIKAKNKNLQIAYDVARKYAPTKIAEIGVRCGYSAWAMLQAMPDAEFYGYDNYSYKPKEVCECAQEYLLEGYNWNVWEMDSQKIKQINIENIDLFHVDGDHSYAGCYHDLELAYKSIAKNGVILVDDTKLVPEVAQACLDFIWVHDDYEIEIQDDEYYGTWLIRSKQSGN